jgi:hypothetical protein
MTLRIAEDGEDIGWRGSDRALDFDSLGHLSDLCRTPESMWRFGERDKGVEVRDHVPMTRPLAMLVGAATLGAAALIPAGPSGADPGLDASFLDALTKAGITVKNESGAVKAGKAACEMMDQGRPQIDVVQLVTRQNPGLDTTRAAQFTAIAASAYCPQHLQHAAEPPAGTAEPPTG